MTPELGLIAVMTGVLLALSLACAREWWLKRRADRQLEDELRMRRGAGVLRRSKRPKQRPLAIPVDRPSHSGFIDPTRQQSEEHMRGYGGE